MNIINVAIVVIALVLLFLFFLAGAYFGQAERKDYIHDVIERDRLEEIRDKLTLRCEDLEEHGKLSEMNALMYAVDLIEEELNHE